MIDTLPPLREVIARHGISAERKWGQNFLLDLNVTAKIARFAGELSDRDVLEIGPGPGGLTRALLAAGARRVVAIERDRRCLPALDEIAAAYPGRLEVIEGDALAVDAAARVSPGAAIVANLPYNIGTELLVRWLDVEAWPPFWSGLTLMFQREVAERIVARPDTPAYGRLAVLAGWRARAGIAFSLPASAFTPPPKVASAVVSISPLAAPSHSADRATLAAVTASAFGQRRKMLRSALKGLTPDAAGLLLAAGINGTRRAETLSIEEFCRLANAFDAMRAAGSP